MWLKPPTAMDEIEFSMQTEESFANALHIKEEVCLGFQLFPGKLRSFYSSDFNVVLNFAVGLKWDFSSSEKGSKWIYHEHNRYVKAILKTQGK
jgi:hypothetical protein